MTGGLEQELCDSRSQYVMHNLKAFEGKQNATLSPVRGLPCLLVTVVSVVKGRSAPFLCSQGRGTGSSSYVEGDSIVERIRTTSACWVGEMCWVM